jgi:hypothetical protein
MNTRSRSVRAALVAVVTAVAGAVLLSGCGQQADTQAASQAETKPVKTAAQPAKPVARTVRPTAEPAAARTPTLTPDEDIPVEHPATTLPPGDPGVDAPAVPNPGRPEGDQEHDGPARTEVPAVALLDGQTVSGVLGGDWAQSQAQPLDCLAGSTWVAQRSAAFDSAEGRVLLTVATHRSLGAADRSVEEQLASLRDCGWTAENAPRMGTASSAASNPDGGGSAVVLSSDGVTVTLVGSGDATARHRRWMSLLDLALGSSCAAASDGCHDQYSSESAE